MIRIVTDSASSLSEDLVKKYHIKVVNYTFVLDGEEIEDDNSIVSADEIYSKIEKTDNNGKLIAPTARKYEEIYEHGVKNGDEDFIVITTSMDNNASYNAAVRARDNFFSKHSISGIRIAIIDSRNMASGCGYLVIKTARLRDNGITFNDLVEFADKYKLRIKGYVCVSDAISLSKMGFMKTKERKIRRVTDDIVMLTTDKNGMGIMLGQANGIDEVYRTYTEDFIKQVDKELTDFIIIEYSSDISRAEGLKKYFLSKTHFKGIIYFSQLPPSGGAVLGLGSIGLSYVTKSSGDAFADLFRRVGAVTKIS